MLLSARRNSGAWGARKPNQASRSAFTDTSVDLADLAAQNHADLPRGGSVWFFVAGRTWGQPYQTNGLWGNHVSRGLAAKLVHAGLIMIVVSIAVGRMRG